MAKLLENTYRHVNIALVNEMARFCHELDIDLWDVIDCAETKPFGFQAFYPGPGVGGHCIPIDPNYLSPQGPGPARLPVPLRRAGPGDQRDRCRATSSHRAQDAAQRRRRRRVNGLDGAAARGHVQAGHRRRAREPGGATCPSALVAHGATVLYHDPFVEDWRALGGDVKRVDDPLAAAEDADLTILVQNHSSYDVAALADAARRLLDTRGVAPVNERVQRL